MKKSRETYGTLSLFSISGWNYKTIYIFLYNYNEIEIDIYSTILYKLYTFI